MANYTSTKAAINAAIKSNGANEITGPVLNAVLQTLVTNLGDGYRFKGMVSPSSAAMTTDNNVFVIASSAGTYTNYGGLTVADGELAALVYTTAWSKLTLYSDDDKMDKVDDATVGDIPQFVSDGSVEDSGKKVSDFRTSAAQDVIDATKADKDGYYATLTSGSAENLVGRGKVEAQYTHRTSGGTADIGTGNAFVRTMKGNAVVMNQQMSTNLSISGSVSGITATFVNGKLTLNGTATATGYLSFDAYCPKNHYGYFSLSKTKTGLKIGNGWLFSSEKSTILRNTSVDTILYIEITSGTSFDNFECYPMLIDLTVFFQNLNVPTTAAAFEALYPLDYYAYNAGAVLGNKTTGIKTIGFNQYDEVWSQGLLRDNTGEIVDNSYAISSTNFNGCFPEITYYGFVDDEISTHYFEAYFYDKNKSYLGVSSKATCKNTTFVTPKNAYFYKIRYFNQLETITPSGAPKVCINISHSGYRDGDYEAYEEHTLSLNLATLTGKASGSSTSETIFPEGMLSAGSVYDEIAFSKVGVATKAIKRIGKRAYQSGDESDSTVVTDKTNTYYALATPIEYTLDNSLTGIYSVNDFGTETQLPQNGSTPTTAPVFYDVTYAMNAVDTLRNLPKNYAGIGATAEASTMNSILTAMQSAGVIGGFTLTYDSTNARYNCTVTAPSASE